MRAALDDVRCASRLLAQQPAFCAVAVLTLALGIGASTAIFSIVNAVVFRPTSIVRTDDLYYVSIQRRPDPSQPKPPTVSRDDFVSVADFRAFAAHPPEALTGAASVWSGSATVRVPGHAQRTNAEGIDGGYAAVFGLVAEAGRMIEAADDASGAAVCVISDRMWRDWFNRDRSVLGRRTLTVNNSDLTIVGVAPVGFRGLNPMWVTVDVWEPLTVLQAGMRELAGRPDLRDRLLGQIYARARPGAPADAVRAATQVLVSRDGGDDPRGLRAIAVPAWASLRIDPLGAAGVGIMVLSGLVLFAACANLANMLYARGTERESEVATRLSLGASRAAVFRLFAAEAAIVSALAVVVGLALALGGLRLAGLAAGSSLLPQAAALRGRNAVLAADLAPDLRVLAYALAAGAVTALIVGAATAWRASRIPPARILAGSSAGAVTTPASRRIREGLVALQVTVAVLLLMATGLLVVRASAIIQTKVFLDTAGVTAARVDLSLHDYNATRGRAFYDDVLARVGRLPGVEAAALTDGLPGYAYVSAPNFLLVAEKGKTGIANQYRRITGAYAGVSGGFFETLGLTLARGRRFVPTDRYGAPLVTIVTESTASRLWPGEDALGKRLMFGSEGYWRTVVGIATDPLHKGTDSPHDCQSCLAFVPWDQRYRPEMLVMVKSKAAVTQVEPLKAAIRAVDPDVALQDVGPLDDSILAWVRPVRAATMLVLSLAGVALFIAGLGVYGVISYIVGLRTREFGIRLALGATPRRVLKMVLDHAIHLVLVGLLPGVLIAALGGQIALISDPEQPAANALATWIVVPLLLVAVGVVAGYLPARRASRVDPNTALRGL
ncbi:MAG TPA: ABC transporter permease [Vicinamibacterales bacterium]|nr:ABC transporter permease [Vicinamibacterales bacterium]